MATRDVQFVIRARDEASRALDGITDSLEGLANAQNGLKGGGSVAQLLNNLKGFDAVAGSIGAANDKAAAAFARQGAKVDELKAKLNSLEAQRIASVRAAAQVNAAGAATGDTAGAAAKIKAIEAAQAAVVKQKNTLLTQIQREENALKSLASEYQRIASIAHAVEAIGPTVADIQAQAAAAQAVAGFAKDIGDQVEREVDAREKATKALKDQAAAAKGEVHSNFAQDRINALLGVKPAGDGGAAKASAAVFDEQARAAEAVALAIREVGVAEERTAIAAKTLRDRIDPVGAIYRRMEGELEKVRDLHRQGAVSAEEMAAAERVLGQEAQTAVQHLERTAKGAGGKNGLFGLKPYELTNLGYQVNDVVTQLASGTGLMQVLAQQGGQILQLFPKLGANLLAAIKNPYILAAAAAFGALALAVNQAANNAERLRMLSGILKGSADGAKYSAVALNDNVKALKEYHMTAEQATGIVRTFIKEGLNPAYFEQAGRAAKDMSRVLGTDVTDAAQKVATAFSGGYDAIAELDDGLNFLTASERKHIRALFDSGKSADARRLAFEKFAKAQREAAEDMRGPWTKAIERVDSAWEKLKDNIGDSEFAKDVLEFVNDFATGLGMIASGIEWINKLKGDSSGGTSVEGLNKPGQSVTVTLPPASDDTKSAESEAEAKVRAERQDDIDFERRAANAVSDASRIKIAGERAYREEIRKTGDVKAAEYARDQARAQTGVEIQRGRREDLLGTAESFLGRRENDREDNAALQALFKTANIKLDPAKMAWCAAFVNAVLNSKGLPTSGSMAASSFKNYGTATNAPEKGDIVVLKPQARGATGHVGFFEGFDANGNVRVLGGNQGKDGAVSKASFKRSDVVSFRRPGNIGEGAEGLDSEVQAAIQLGLQQDGFNKKLEIEGVQRQLAIKYLREQLGLSAQQLFDSERRQAIETAISNAEREAKDKRLTFSAEQKKQLEEQVGAAFDLEHAQQLVNDRLSEQQTLRDALMRGIEAAQARGDTGTVAALKGQLDATDAALTSAIDAAEKFWKQFDTPEAKAALESLRMLRQEVADTQYTLMQGERASLERNASGLNDLRGQLASQIDMAQKMGDGAGAEQLEVQLGAVTHRLVEANQKLIEFWQNVAGDPAALAAMNMTGEQVQAIIMGLQQANVEATEMGRQFLMTGREINESLADMGTSAIDGFFQKVAEGQNVIQALWNTFIQFAADFLRQIAMMMLKQALFNALSNKSASGGGGVGGMISSAIGSLMPTAAPLMAAGTTLSAAGGVLTTASAGLGTSAASLMAAAQMLMVANSMKAGMFHGGGVVGAPSMSRSLSPMAFLGATRYHSGGLAGLRPNEVPTILERNEEVLTRSDPRHRMNGGLTKGGAGGGMGDSFRQVLAIGDDEIANAMAGDAGERTVMTILRRNRTTLKQWANE